MDKPLNETERMQLERYQGVDPSNGNLHETWYSKSREELLDALQFQSCVTKDLFKAEAEIAKLVPLLKDANSILRLMHDDAEAQEWVCKYQKRINDINGYL